MLTMQEVLDGLRATGERLDWESDVEIVVAGAAACLITRVLDKALTTVGCDVLDFNPQVVRDAVIRAAKKAAAELGLSSMWLNDDVKSIEAQQDMLPLGWRKRLRLVETYGKLRVYALDRFDLLATKLFAGRAIALAGRWFGSDVRRRRRLLFYTAQIIASWLRELAQIYTRLRHVLPSRVCVQLGLCNLLLVCLGILPALPLLYLYSLLFFPLLFFIVLKVSV